MFFSNSSCAISLANVKSTLSYNANLSTPMRYFQKGDRARRKTLPFGSVVNAAWHLARALQAADGLPWRLRIRGCTLEPGPTHDRHLGRNSRLSTTLAHKTVHTPLGRLKLPSYSRSLQRLDRSICFFYFERFRAEFKEFWRM